MDQRANDMLKKIVSDQKNLIVQWSGGIDSTGILVAILRNFSKSDLERVTVACNWGSIIEAPVFYHNHILPNFKCVDINYITQKIPEDNNFLSTGGTAADTLLTSMAPGFEQHMSVTSPLDLQRSWKNPDRLISYLDQITEKPGFGIWFYEKISQNVQSIDVPIETYFDFMWWAGFCYNWHAQRSGEWFHHHRNRSLSFKDHQQIYTGWFTTNEFQQWSMNNNKVGIKYGTNLASLKIVAKKYIYNYTKDQWYFKYKTKQSSAGRRGLMTDDVPFAVTNQFDILYLKKDIDKIKQYLPDYILSSHTANSGQP